MPVLNQEDLRAASAYVHDKHRAQLTFRQRVQHIVKRDKHQSAFLGFVNHANGQSRGHINTVKKHVAVFRFAYGTRRNRLNISKIRKSILSAQSQKLGQHIHALPDGFL